MKSFFAAFLALGILLGCVVSCRPTPSDVQPVIFDTLSVDTICPLFKNYEKPACHLSLKMAVPVQETTADVREAIERFVSQLPKDGAFDEDANGSIAAMMQAYVKAYLMQYLNEGPDAIDNYGEDMEAAATWMSYEEKATGTVIYNADDMLSYQIRTDSYTGGAHGNTGTVNGVFDLKHLSEVRLSDVFEDVSLSDLNQLLRLKLARQYECETVDELQAKGLFFSPAEIEVTENFYVTDAGICWMYDPYDIAPYSTGEVSVTLSWDELYPFLSVDSPLMAMAQKYSTQG